jgi:raffinose/stachyose/melibiose transport system substrate-binding protein
MNGLSSATHTGRCAAFAVAALVVAASSAACSAPGSGSGTSAEQVNPTSVSTDLGDEPVELTLYDGAGLKSVDEALIAAFTKQYPNVTVTTRFDPDNVQSQNAPRVLASDDPPDIARINALADIVGNGQLTKLDAYAEAYGWDNLPEGQLAMYRVDSDGVRGQGSQYTLASGFVVTGLYYNKDVAKQVGMDGPPTTVEELEAGLAAAKDAGVIPLMAGNQTGQVVFSVQMLLNNALGQQSVNDWVFNAAGASIDTDQAASAVARAADWAERGYFPADTNGTDSTAALGRFARGEALFYASGNWDAASLQKQMAGKIGFVVPPAVDGQTPLAMSDPVSNFGIPARSDDKDAAAAFLNFLLSDEARQVVVDAGFAPSGEGEEPKTEPGSLNAEVQQAFAELVDADGQVQFVQNATSGINATWLAQTQLLVAGKTSGEDYLASIQADYEEELGR